MKKSIQVLSLSGIIILTSLGFSYFYFEAKGVETVAFPDVPLELVYPSSEGSFNPHAGSTVVLVFSLTDCGTCLDILDQLNMIVEDHENALPLVGIIDTRHSQAVNKIQQVYGIEFPLYQDNSGVIKKSFTDIAKPVLLYLNNGTVLNRAIVGHPEDGDKVAKIIERLRKGKMKK